VLIRMLAALLPEVSPSVILPVPNALAAVDAPINVPFLIVVPPV